MCIRACSAHNNISNVTSCAYAAMDAARYIEKNLHALSFKSELVFVAESELKSGQKSESRMEPGIESKGRRESKLRTSKRVENERRIKKCQNNRRCRKRIKTGDSAEVFTRDRKLHDGAQPLRDRPRDAHESRNLVSNSKACENALGGRRHCATYDCIRKHPAARPSRCQDTLSINKISNDYAKDMLINSNNY
ncbi:hypothetical protein EVAR_76775_1 [Eumeta japonica]|uniref:Uncharacterized protein n=1 Tax=Eumeta variegata TaxID=151549 RepID=A0A4C1STT7_EUMVA|nr:hypothetical protein EVAR_76775_1 [Eumeta japonica]